MAAGGAPLYTFAGDGDDQVILGGDWILPEVLAGRGDDVVTVENGF